jgi:hypothetical protein
MAAKEDEVKFLKHWANIIAAIAVIIAVCGILVAMVVYIAWIIFSPATKLWWHWVLLVLDISLALAAMTYRGDT